MSLFARRYVTPLIFLTVCCGLSVQAQTESYDITTFQPPQGWKKQQLPDAVSYSFQDSKASTWCQIALYKGFPGKGNPRENFASEWGALVKPEAYPESVQPSPVEISGDGWTGTRGVSQFKFHGKPARVMLYNISGNGTLVSSIVSTNTDKYDADIEKFWTSIHVTLPPKQSTESIPNSPQTTSASAPTASDHGITSSTTNFNDGWTSQLANDYVKVTKANITVLLHYPIPVDDRMRAASEMASEVWDRLAAKRYTNAQLTVYKTAGYTPDVIHFIYGNAVDKATGKPVFVWFRVVVVSGVATSIEAIAPTEAAMSAEFSDKDKLLPMVGYNKFAVSAKDLIGKWDEGSSTSLSYYNTSTGSYAGTNTAAMASIFTFHADGTYENENKGASGMVGSQKFYDEKYAGKYTLTGWEITMTNRFKGRTDTFLCHYEATQNGRVLNLIDKAFPTTRYRLSLSK